METTGGVRLDDGKYGQMAFRTPPTDENQAILKAEAENLSNDGAIWVTSPWKPSYLGYIGSKAALSFARINYSFEHGRILMRRALGAVDLFVGDDDEALVASRARIAP